MTRGEAIKAIQDRFPGKDLRSTPVGAHGVIAILETLGLLELTDEVVDPDVPVVEPQHPAPIISKPAARKAAKNEG